MKRLGLFVFFFIFLSSFALAEEMYIFYGQGCPHCANALGFLNSIEDKYPELNIIKKETYFNEENRNLFFEFAQSYGMDARGVPMIFIGDKVFYGFDDDIGEDIEKEINVCLKNNCKLKTISKNGHIESLTIPAVLFAALVDAINPCAFAVLIILLTTILAAGIRRRVLYAGLAFIISIYISYFFMGVGIYSAISVSGLSNKFYLIVAILAIIVGLFNLKDYFWYGKWFIMEVPQKWRPKLKALIKSITSVHGAFFIGFAVSLFLLPCTSGPYVVILGLLAKVATKNYAFVLLLLYNFVFILPMLIITLAVTFGLTTTEKAEKWRLKKLKVLHLIAGLIILGLGLYMLISLI